RLLALGIDPLVMPSGGKADADTPAESEAMAAYLTGAAGVPPDRVRAETSSRTTEENLVLSHRLLDAAGLQGPHLVSTSGRPAVAGLPAHGDAAAGRPGPVVPPALGHGRAPDDVRTARPAAARGVRGTSAARCG